MAAVQESRRKIRDFISDLPFELARLVLSGLDIRDVFMCAAVCSSWRSRTISNDTLYIPHLLRKYNNVTHGQDPIPPKANIGQELLHRFPRLSATSYFCNPKSLRDLALRDMHLQSRWGSGVPWRKTNLNAFMKHEHNIISVVIDLVYNLVISGDRSGRVVFWSIQTEKMVNELRCPNEGVFNISPGISAMALKDNHLVIGTRSRTVYIARRDNEDTPIENRSFSLVSSFPVTSSVVSILLEGKTCIVGCHDGTVLFYDIGVPGADPNSAVDSPTNLAYKPTCLLDIQSPERPRVITARCNTRYNLSMHYQKPFLFMSSYLVSQLTPKRIDRDNKRDLWEYGEGVTIKEASHNIPELGPYPFCMLRPLRDEGDLLVAWPDLSVNSLGSSDPGPAWSPRTTVLVEKAHSQAVTCVGTVDGFFLTGSFDNYVRIFKEDGTPVPNPFRHQGAVNSLATDPCFFVSVSEDRTVMLCDFTPPLYGSGESTFSSPSVSSLISCSESNSSPGTSPPSTPGL